MKFEKAIPILYSTDVAASVAYFKDKLKFENSWTWEDPPTFAGLYDGTVEIFFCKDAQGSPATWIAILVDDVDEYYEKIKDTGAKIISPPETKPWSIREMLVECPDGHIIRFGHSTEHD
jgi:uncharacterized glyoxalase superfamily protein PhnB